MGLLLGRCLGIPWGVHRTGGMCARLRDEETGDGNVCHVSGQSMDASDKVDSQDEECEGDAL